MAEPIRILEFGYDLQIPGAGVLALCLLVSFFIFRFYTKERGNSSRSLRLALSFVRSLLCCLVILALLNWHLTIKKYRRPELILGFDSSASLQHLDRINENSQPNGSNGNVNGFKPSRINVLRQKLDAVGEDWFDSLKDQFLIHPCLLGESTRRIEAESLESLKSKLVGLDGQSNLDRGLSQLLKRQVGTSPAAVVLFTDGLDSADPKFARTSQLARSLQIPVYPIGLGEKNPANDLEVIAVQCNPKVFLNDLVEFRMSVSADGFAGTDARLQLIDEAEQEIVSEKSIKVTSNQFREVIRFRARMLQQGTRKFMARLLPVQGEYDTSNNQKSIRVDVDSEPIKVLLAANYPSREFHFLKQFLGRESKSRADLPPEFATNRIELNTFLQQADIEYTNVDRHAIKIFPVTRKQLFAYDVVIFCDLKPNWAGNFAGGLGRNELGHLREFVEENGGGLVFIAGSMYTPAAYANSPIKHLFPLDLDSLVTPDSDHSDSELFDQAFALNRTMYGKRFLPMEIGTDKEPKDYDELAGTFWFASSPRTSPSAVVLADLESAGKKLPGIVMQKVGLGTVLYHAFPESYRWRYRSSDVYFGRYWSQMIQFLASSKLARGEQALVLETDRVQYFRDEPIQVLGQLLDRSLINQETLSVTAKNLSGFERQFELSQSDDIPENYSATLESLGAGSYELFQTGNRQVSTRFEIVDAGREDQRRSINEVGLRKLAQETGGAYLKINRLEELNSMLPERNLIEVGGEPPWVLWSHWEFVSIFGTVFLVLITTEWILRKKAAML